jgi:hypothetical protein
MRKSDWTAFKPMKRPKLMPKVYRALADITLLRDDLNDSSNADMPESEEQRLLLRLQVLETAALHILDHFERQHEITAH